MSSVKFEDMNSAKEKEKHAIISYLRERDCCPRCILRYLGFKGSETYLNAEYYLNDLFDDQETQIDVHPKRIKRNPCPICLDIFQDSTIHTYVERLLSTDINEFNYPDFGISVSFPKSILIRNRSIFIHLKEKFPYTFNDDVYDVEGLNKIFRIIASEIISQKMNKIFSSGSNLILMFEIQYEDDELEIQNIKNITYLCKGIKNDTSRHSIINILEACEDKLFKKQFSVPPTIPIKKTNGHVYCTAEPLWIGGRYLKLSRGIGQTPWIVNDELVVEHCVQDIIFDNVKNILRCDNSKLTFCASGREDADVRMLGNGRPFYIQIDNPKNRSISFEQYRDIETAIFETKKVAVIKLQEMDRNHIRRIKDGEQHKSKHYYALCHVKAQDMTEVVNKIKTYRNVVLKIHQKTPLRVLHRRTQAVREKSIYSMDAKSLPDYPDLLEIKLVTQAGTYVKEFIHGDFQRTQPNLSSIIQLPIDVVALDVTRVELLWPEVKTENV